jgi:hypothetical protein
MHVRSTVADVLLSKKGLLVCVIAVSAAAQSLKAPTFDPKLNSSTIIREDLFAAFLEGGKSGNEKFLRGEKNLEILLAERPQDKGGLTAWEGGIALKRAIDAIETKQMEEFELQYRKALDFYAGREIGSGGRWSDGSHRRGFRHERRSSARPLSGERLEYRV